MLQQTRTHMPTGSEADPNTGLQSEGEDPGLYLHTFSVTA